MLKLVLLVASFCVSFEIVSATTDKVVCYHGVWSIYRYGNGKFTVDDIDPSLCTHLIYAFVGILDDGSIRHLEEYLDINQNNINRFNSLKQKNPNLKTLVAIGGYNEGSIRYSNVAANPKTRANFIKSAVNFVKQWGFDGFDLDWEYPAQRGGAAADIQNFVSLLKEFRKEFDKHGLLLTAAVAAASTSVDLSYDVPALSQYLDIINVMAYDLHGSWDGRTGQNAPLYASSADVTAYQKQLTVDAAIRGWIQRGADPQKIALGLGAYGQSYTLSRSSNTQVGAATSGAGAGGPYTSQPGMLGYNEIVELQKLGGWTTVWDNQQKNPYMYKGNQWVGFDNPKSIAIKVEYAKSLNLGGVMLWSIETDDFKGLSGTKFPLLRTVKQALGEISDEILVPEPQPEPAPEPEPQPEPVPEPQPQPETTTGSVCSKVGYVRDSADCSIFYYCLFHNGGFIPLQQKCNNGLVFDETKLICDYPQNVQC